MASGRLHSVRSRVFGGAASGAAAGICILAVLLLPTMVVSQTPYPTTHPPIPITTPPPIPTAGQSNPYPTTPPPTVGQSNQSIPYPTTPPPTFSPSNPELDYTYRGQTGLDYPGNDIHPEGPSPKCGTVGYEEDAATCKTRCNGMANCAGYVHTPDINCCYIKSQLANPTPNIRCNTHAKSGYQGYESVEYGVDFAGADIVPPAGAACGGGATVEDISSCIYHCNNNPACVAIAYYADVSCCFLKSGMGNGRSANNRVTYYTKRYVAP